MSTGKQVSRTAGPGLQHSVPALYAPTAQAAKRFIEYFAANIRNPNTRRAYLHAVLEFSAWCEAQNLTEILDIEPLHVAAYIEMLGKRLAKPWVKQQLAAIRMLFDWLVVGQVIATNPAAPVRGPKYTGRKGKTPILSAEEARTLLDSIPASPRGAPRSGTDRAHGLYLCARRRRAQDARRGHVRSKPRYLGSPARERG